MQLDRVTSIYVMALWVTLILILTLGIEIDTNRCTNINKDKEIK